MRRFLVSRQTLSVTLLLAATVPAVFFAREPQATPPANTSVVRGNAPGEWRYWGADAWSTRYSPLDQITAANFNSLQIAWQWKVGSEFGEDEYFRSTPLYAKGRMYTVAGRLSATWLLDNSNSRPGLA